MELAQDQLEAAKALGCTFFPAPEGQVARLAMQRRIFTIAAEPFVTTRDDGGFYETNATLALLLEAHGRGAMPDAGDRWVTRHRRRAGGSAPPGRHAAEGALAGQDAQLVRPLGMTGAPADAVSSVNIIRSSVPNRVSGRPRRRG